MSIFVSGAAGFIGFHLCKKLIKQNEFIIGYDNLNNYYDPSLKKARINELRNLSKSDFLFLKGDLEDIQRESTNYPAYQVEWSRFGNINMYKYNHSSNEWILQ